MRIIKMLIPAALVNLMLISSASASPLVGAIPGRSPCKISMARQVSLPTVVNLPDLYAGNNPDPVINRMKAWANYFMRLSSNARVSDNAKTKLVAEMILVASSNRLVWPKGWDKGQDRPSSVIYHTMETIFPFAVAYAQNKATFSPREQKMVEKWLGNIVDRIGRSKEIRRWKLDNKKYQYGALAAAFGYASGKKKYTSTAISIFKNAIRGQRADGSLPGDSGRGGNALHYTNLALANLTAIAEFASASGVDLYSYRSGRKSIHTAIAFLAAATKAPRLISGYAAQQTGASFNKYSPSNLDKRWASQSAASWAYYYLRRYGNTQTGQQLKTISKFLRSGKSGVHQQSGGNARCFVG